MEHEQEYTPLVLGEANAAAVPKKNLGRTRIYVSIAIAAGVVGGAAAISGYTVTSASSDDDSTDVQGYASEACDLSATSAQVYKYTISSSYAHNDSLWAKTYLGCEEFDLSNDCEPGSNEGKTQCSNMDLHFIVNDNTDGGEKAVDVSYWDDYEIALHEEAFNGDKMDQFMDYSITFYTPDLSKVMQTLVNDGHSYLARKRAPDMYTLFVTTPGGKTVEILSHQVEDENLKVKFMEWTDYDECYSARESHLYNKTELKAWYSKLNGPPWGQDSLMPIRTNVAVSSLDTVTKWWKSNMPGVTAANPDFKTYTTQNFKDKDTQMCQSTSLALDFYGTDMQTEIRFIENPHAHTGKHTITDFTDYLAKSNSEFGGKNGHNGLNVDGCSLDSFMSQFAATNTPFHPHGINTTTESTSHVWTPGSESWGVEMQGSFDYTYAKCYSSSGCTSTTDATEGDLWMCKDGYTFDATTNKIVADQASD